MREFKGGRKRVENKNPRTNLTDDSIRAVRDLIERDLQKTVEEMSSGVGISYGSVQSIITDELGFRKISVRWVLRMLTENHKLVRSEIAGRLLDRFQQEGEAFLKCIVTCDETWLHHYTVELKMTSKDRWRNDYGCQ